MKRDVAAVVRPHGLTPKERAFCEAYVGGPATAGKSQPSAVAAGYSPRTAEKNAGLILRRPHVMAFIKQRLNEQFAAERMTNEEILARTARIARMDPREFFDESGKPRPISELTAEQAYNLRAFESKQEEFGSGANAKFTDTTKLKLADPLHALALLAKINKLTTNETTQLNVFVDLDARMDRAKKRRMLAIEKSSKLDSDVVSDQ